MRSVTVYSNPALPVVASVAAVTYVDHEDGRGWCGRDGMPVDAQQNLITEVCYLQSSPREESKERGQLLFDVWYLSKQLSTASLQTLLTVAMSLRD